MSYCQAPRTCYDSESKPFDNEKSYVFPDENIVIVCVVRFHFGDVRYQSSFTVKEAGRFYDTSCQSIMSVTFTSAKSCVLCRLRCHDNVLRHSYAHNEGAHDGNQGGCSCSQGPKELVEKLATLHFPALGGVLGAVPVDKIMVYVIVASFSEIVQDTIAVTIHNSIKEMYDWSGWHVGTSESESNHV